MAAQIISAELPPPKPKIPWEKESEHYADVIASFRDYSFFMQLEASRRLRAADKLPERYKKLLPTGGFERKSALLQEAIRTNQALLNAIADEQEEAGFGVQFRNGPTDETGGLGTEPSSLSASSACDHDHHSGVSHADARPEAPAPSFASITYAPRRSAANYSKVRSTLHQLVRDWSAEGAAERAACYGIVMRELTALLPVTSTNANRQRVLVPGCGLGRLVFDLALAGYAAQGNEFSYQMLFASHLMLNATEAAGQWEVHPWIHDPSNHLRPEDMLRAVRVPDCNPRDLAERNPGADMSMTAGEFGECYSTPDQQGAWDAVTTVFFIDTAPVVMEYFDILWHALKPGGYWINLGPLLYHWQGAAAAEAGHDSDDVDPRYEQSLELSYQEAMLEAGGQWIVAIASLLQLTLLCPLSQS